jgi:hypothetical protein
MPNDNDQIKPEEGLLDGEQSTPQEEPLEKKPEDHEPPPEHPRFKEIYGKMKNYEREIEAFKIKDSETSEALKIVQAHNKALMEAVTGFEDKFSDINKPDPELDREGYEKWIIDKAKREALRDQGTKPKEEPPPPVKKGKVDMREIEYAGEHEDYYDVINTIREEVQKNPNVSTQIWNSTHPFEAAYKYGKAKQKREAQRKKALDDQGFVEGNNPPPPETKVTLSNEEKRAAKMLGVSEEAYAKQKKFIESKRG